MRASSNRFSLGTSDGSSFVRLRGVLHIDGRHFEGDGTPATSNTWLLRRVRPIVEGSFANIYDFRFTPDFAQGRTVIQDAFITARFRPWAAVTVGKFKVPVGPERIQSATDLRFIGAAFHQPRAESGYRRAGRCRHGRLNRFLSVHEHLTPVMVTQKATSRIAEAQAAGNLAGCAPQRPPLF